MAFYIESADRPPKSRLPAEDVPVGTLVVENGSDKVKVAAFADSRFDGVADQPLTGEQIVEYEDVDDPNFDVYEAAEDERVTYGGDEDRARIKVRTAEDNGTDPAPSISDGDIVGIAANGAEYAGRLVEEGYTDDGGTTYGTESTGDFLPVGVAYRDEGTTYDTPVRVEVRYDL